MTKADLVFKATAYIPQGYVLTYGQLAQLAGVDHPRLVGSILHQNPDPHQIPCHRVINSSGGLAASFAFGGAQAQRSKLQAEGITFKGPKVKLSQHLWHPPRLLRLFFQLLKKYGEPGHWPWFGSDSPHGQEEIAIGAILTQNISWRNVKLALGNLKQAQANTLSALAGLNIQRLRKLIRPAGFYNQKARCLKEFTRFISNNYGTLEDFLKEPSSSARRQLLKIRGIGPETADTILLYAGNKLSFVIDAYTKRFVEYYGFRPHLTYRASQDFFMTKLPPDIKLYQDYHALIVKWAQDK